MRFQGATLIMFELRLIIRTCFCTGPKGRLCLRGFYKSMTIGLWVCARLR